MPQIAWTEGLAGFAAHALQAQDADELTQRFQGFAAGRGMSGFACGEIDLRDLRRTVMFAADWPADWMEIYARERLVEHDPAVSALGRLSGIVGWGMLREESRSRTPVFRSVEAAEDYGWRDGVFVPIPRGGSRYGLATATGMQGPLSPEERSEIGVALVLFYERFRALGVGRPPAASFSGLTPRELDCLALVASGADDQGIADRLKIARSTAHDHIERAKRRLNVRTRAEAVAITVSLGLIAL